MRRGTQSAFSNPVLIGAVTVLVTLVAVFLAYNSNSGLPFVPTRELKVNVSDGSELVVGNEVREGGFQVGLLADMRPVRLSAGQVGAQLTLQLSKKNGNVPVDSRASIKPLSLLGLKYVDITRGQSRKLVADGGVLPISRTTVPVQVDDIFNMFNDKTRVAIQQDLAGYGTVLAGRGSALNDTLYSLPSLLGHLQPVAHYLSQPSTGLVRFFNGLNEFMGAVAPVAHTNVLLFRDMATTFGAISRDPNALEQTIARSPSTLDVSTASLRVQQPFLGDLATFGRFMTPATAALNQALPILNPALEAGTRTLARSPVLNAKLQRLMSALKRLAQAPGTNVAINGLADTTTTLNPMIRYLGPFQTVCNYWNYWWTFLSEHISEQTQYGLAQRVLLNFGDATQPNNIGQQGAVQPANGQAGGPEFLHGPNYGAAIDNLGNADCETGQRGYPKKLNYFDPQGRNLDSDPHTPGNQGPTFAGRTRVPTGETFTRNPSTGSQLAYNPSNP
jgi:phospholipid/cholesterol/gamma-HCH transport system substrate-binding protein